MASEIDSSEKVTDYLRDSDVKRRKEKKARLIIVFTIAFLTLLFAAWNIWRMVIAVQEPVVTIKDVTRSEIPVPGVVFCGTSLDMPINCFKAAMNQADDNYAAAPPCDEYIRSPTDASSYVNLQGFVNLTNYYCYEFNPSVPASGDGPPLRYNSTIQKIILSLWSKTKANNTLGAITNDAWYLYAVFSEVEDPRDAMFQIVKFPAITYVYFKRLEKYDSTKSDAITGGRSSAHQNNGAHVELDTTLSTFDIEGFGISANLWGIFRIIPERYNFDAAALSYTYPVEIWNNRVEFTLLQMAANMGGFVSILTALYLLLFGTRRTVPWGVVQKYVLKNIPPPPPVYTPATLPPYADSRFHASDQAEANRMNNLESTTNHPEVTPYPDDAYPTTASPPAPFPYYGLDPADRLLTAERHNNEAADDQEAANFYELNDPVMLRLRQELRMEVQSTIANELAKMRAYLNKYYFQGEFKSE
ncbi:3751_t:CDS:2 [Paraglomus brasilianum]|uniref:3751_t:CDS:1 n=1 Tax=Paraglomus brasilianum TaxID=144538 RepID=A0A9N8WSJ3_9GLOM|nr:3751_t:CDS:2 [Paraglomus brasilianum]